MKKQLGILIVLTLLVVFVLFLVFSLPKYFSAKTDLFTAIDNRDYTAISKIITQYPSLVNSNRVTIGFFARITDCSSNTPLLEACRSSDLDMVKLLVENGADIDKGSNVVPAYPIISALTAHPSVAHEMSWYLIENGADLTVSSSFYTVPWAIVSKPVSDDDEDDMIAAVDLLRFVVENGAPLTPPDKNFYGIDCLLGYASRNNHSLVCQYLLDNDFFDVNDVVDEYGATALIVAAKAPNETFGACKVLLENGADKTLKDNFGKTAYDYSVENGHARLRDLLEDSKM